MKKLNAVLNNLEEYLAVSTLVFTSLLVFLQVILRYVFNYSLVWSEETARYLIIWFIFIGSSIAVRENAHAAVDAVVVYLPRKWKIVFSLLASIAAMAFCVIIVISGIASVLNVMEFGSVTPSLGIPMYIPYLALPVGGTLMFIRFLQQLIGQFKQLISRQPVEEGPVMKEVSEY